MENPFTRIYVVDEQPTLLDRIKAFLAQPGGKFFALMLFLVLGQALISISSTLIEKIWYLPAIIISLTMHEYSHARMADFLGDPTPRRTGRLSLNPLKHLDVFGTILMIFTSFGWAKPVGVNPNNCRNPKRAMMSIALAGPASNLVMALIAAGLMKLTLLNIKWLIANLGLNFVRILYGSVLMPFLVINVSLMIFNLIPFPPLDGSRVLAYFIPDEYMFKYRAFETVAPMVLFALMAFGFFNILITPTLKASLILITSAFGLPM